MASDCLGLAGCSLVEVGSNEEAVPDGAVSAGCGAVVNQVDWCVGVADPSSIRLASCGYLVHRRCLNGGNESMLSNVGVVVVVSRDGRVRVEGVALADGPGETGNARDFKRLTAFRVAPVPRDDGEPAAGPLVVRVDVPDDLVVDSNELELIAAELVGLEEAEASDGLVDCPEGPDEVDVRAVVPRREAEGLRPVEAEVHCEGRLPAMRRDP